MSTVVPQPNTRVVHRAHPEYGFGVVRYVEEDALGETRLQVAFDHLDQLQALRPEEVEPVAHPLEDAVAGHWGDVAAFKRKLAAGIVISEYNLTRNFTRSAIQPLPHQVYVLDRVVSGNRFGHVLADDVGMGKTIETGLIISSLIRREPPQRVLIVCPAGLALQWQDEMKDHFNLHFSILGTNFRGRLVEDWRNQSAIIAPIDRIKRKEYQELLEQVGTFDLVVCDEAHRLTARRNPITKDLEKTVNYRFFEFLVQRRIIRHVMNADGTPRSPRLLLLSGTPHQGDDERFLRLLHLVRPDLFQPDTYPVTKQLTGEALAEVIVRTPKSRGVDWDGKKLFKGHVTRTIKVSWTAEEQEVSELLSEYIIESLENSRGLERSYELVIKMVMHSFHKIAASSWNALGKALERRANAVYKKQQQTLGELLKMDDDWNDNDSLESNQPLRVFFPNEQNLLTKLQNAIQSLQHDSKWDRCSELLMDIENHEPGAKILFFTQYRATQEYLCAQLRGLFGKVDVEQIHGEMTLEERREARWRFANESRFLVSTEAGGEGINLQRACHILVNYDLPWNPMRLLQRIGRLDRYGQMSKVQVFNFSIPESWDARISQRILERLAVIQSTMNLAGVKENYNEMILGEVAEKVDVADLFARSVRGEKILDEEVDDWIKGAIRSAERFEELIGNASSFNSDPTTLRPNLTESDFRLAFSLALTRHGLSLHNTRNSKQQVVRDVYHFELPEAFRDPLFRPSRTCHVVFDRNVFHKIRDEKLGEVRGQPIRPMLVGFSEPVTDWLFQSAVQPQSREGAFYLHAGNRWKYGEGWLLVYLLRWMGESRRLNAPDALSAVFCRGREVRLINEKELIQLVDKSKACERVKNVNPLSKKAVNTAQKVAQMRLRELVKLKKGVEAGSFSWLTLWMVAYLSNKLC